MIAEDLAELPADRFAELLHACTVELAERHELDACNYVARALACLHANRQLEGLGKEGAS